MEKLVYVLADDDERTGAELRETLIVTVVPALRDGGARYICVNVGDDDVAGGMAMSFVEPPVRAMLSFWMENSDDRALCETALGGAVERVAGYLVVESRLLVHERRPGHRSPGVKQVTCITKKADLGWEDFIDIWHNDHKHVAMETQSTVGYVRNVVVRRLTEGAPPWDGIVEEVFPIEALQDPKVYFAAETEAQFRSNLARMIKSVDRFLDNEPIEVTQMSEYWVG